MRTFSLLRALPLAALFLVACSDDGALRSPDLPAEELIAIGNIGCSPSSIAVGQTAQCQIVGDCIYRQADAEGQFHEVVRACPPGGDFNSSNPNVAPVDDDGIVTGTAPGVTEITVTIDGTTSPKTPITVNGACAETLTLSPQNATLIEGLGLNYTATVTYSNGSTQNVSTSPGTTFSSSNTQVVTFNANRATAAADVPAQTVVTVSVTTTAAQACGGGALNGSTSLTVRPAQLLATDGLCLEVAGDSSFTGCREDTGACMDDTAIGFTLSTPPQTRQLLVRARYDNGQECNVTLESELSSAPAGIVGIDDNGVASGLAAGTTTLEAAFGGQETTRPATVSVDNVLGNNSLAVLSQKIRAADPYSYRNSQKFACVGANDLVVNGLGGRTKRGFLALQALAQTCKANQLDPDGNCTAPLPEGGDPVAEGFDFVELTDDVTNLMPTGADPLNDRIVWKSVPGYWNGREQGCVESGNPADTPAKVGDRYIDPRALQFGPGDAPNPDGFPIDDPAQQPNGLVYADAAIRLGFSCVTATYTNPQNPSDTVTDGMTILVLPATNDVLLGGSGDGEGLCETLTPLFSNPLLGLIELTPVLNGITSNLNPTLLQQLDVIPLDDITTQVVNGLSPLTGPLVDALDEFLIDPVLEPVVCQLTGVVNLLLGGLTGTPPNQECNTD